MDLDTPPEARARYHALLRAASFAQRTDAMAALSDGVRSAAEAGIRLRHPHATEDEVRVRLTVRLYGRTVAERLFGAVPDDAR